MTHLYWGRRPPLSPCAVFVIAERGGPVPLDPSYGLRVHSPSGFEWGYNGSGPAQLALAILHHHTGCPELAEALYQAFKRDVVAKLPHAMFVLSAGAVDEWLCDQAFETCDLEGWSDGEEGEGCI